MSNTTAISKQIQTLGYLNFPINPEIDLVAEIKALKKQKNAVILAHYYQVKELQEIADYIGDSLGLSQEAAKTKADIIVFAGVHFMGETAKIINPQKKVIIPDLKAGCSLADSCPPDEFERFINSYPDHIVITYINCSAEIKALSDIVCTSSNAVKIINSVPKDQKIVFAPDYNLGKYLQKETGRDMVLWKGACVVHEAFSIDKILELHKKYPDAAFIAHPESESHILEIADFIGSTTALINYVKKNSGEEFIIATEAGILHQMRIEAPGKKLIAAPSVENNTCACSECGYMKLNTMEKLYLCMVHEQPEVKVKNDLQKSALRPIQRMLDISMS